MQPEVFFLKSDSQDCSQRFCLYYPAQDTLRGQVLYIHPFAEEMNKARRMAALQARTLARGGFDVLQMDLLGCGDSSGDFGDANWSQWVNDVRQACQWLRTQRSLNLHGDVATPLWLWGLRAGCLLAVQAAHEHKLVCDYLFWQPPVSGRSLLQQFLRLKVAGNLQAVQPQNLMTNMRQQLADGVSVEIGGYLLAPELAKGLEQSALAPPTNNPPGHRMAWFEISMQENPHWSPAATQNIARWQQSGFTVGCQMVHGPAFWQSSEIEEVPALISASLLAIS